MLILMLRDVNTLAMPKILERRGAVQSCLCHAPDLLAFSTIQNTHSLANFVRWMYEYQRNTLWNFGSSIQHLRHIWWTFCDGICTKIQTDKFIGVCLFLWAAWWLDACWMSVSHKECLIWSAHPSLDTCSWASHRQQLETYQSHIHTDIKSFQTQISHSSH